MSYTRLRAPAGGRISSVDVEANENVRVGQTVAVLTSAAEMEVEVAVPEVLISRIREGDSVTAAFDALPDRSFAAAVTEVGVTTGGLATTFLVTVRLDRLAGNSGFPGNVAHTDAPATVLLEHVDSRGKNSGAGFSVFA